MWHERLDLSFWKTAALKAFGVVLVSGGIAVADEPGEKQLCSAIDQKMDQVNQEMERLSELCANRAYENNPALAMHCLGQYAVSAGEEPVRYEITRCEKIACQKAVSQPGYICDYIIGVDMPGNAAMGQWVRQLASSGGAGQARFVETQRGWLFIP